MPYADLTNLQQIAADIKANIVDGLTSDASEKFLSAKQGKTLDEKKANSLDIASFLVGSETFTSLPTVFTKIVTAFVANAALAIGSVSIPRYSRGIIVSIFPDAILMAIDPNGKLYIAYKNGSTWASGRQL